MSNSTPRNLDDRGLPAGYVFREEWEVTPRQVQAMRQDGEDVVLLDCRTPREYDAARIEGAQLVPMQTLAARLPELREKYGDRKVVVHCHHGGRSMRVTQFLRQQGFRDVKSLAGGIDVWSLDIDPSVPRY